jgi:hypothetical protein
MLVRLPNGLVDGADHFNVVEVDELRGKQQNYLADKELVVGNIGHVPKILEDMILSLQTEQGLKWQGKIPEVIWKLSSGDLETILIKIRENTYGPRFYHQAQCTHCQHIMINLRLDLDKLEIKYYPLTELVKPKVLTLPKSGLEVELKPIFLRDLFDSIKIMTGKQDKLVTSVLALSMKRLGNNQKVTSQDVENLSMRDLDYLRDQSEGLQLEGEIDTNVQIDCSNCHKEFEMKLNVFDPSFFAPTKGSPTSNT